jgi:uracil-DNA glycosylase
MTFLNWSNELNPFTLDKVDDIINILKHDKKRGLKIYPDLDDVFRVYRLVDPKNVKCVILSKCPYNDGNADGIAFSCNNNITPSLKQIQYAIAVDQNISKFKYNKDLTYLTDQGVLLLNNVLAVTNNYDYYKDIGFDILIKDTLSVVLRHNKNCPILLWGSEAKSYNKYLTKLKPQHVLENTHPAHAARNDIEWKCNHFSKVNQILMQNNKSVINWL